MPESKRKIVIVEDEPFLASMYSTKFELAGFEVYRAEDGLVGERLVKEKQPDLVLLDVVMPKKDGFEVLSNLRKDEPTSKLPVVLLTNLGQKSDIEKGLKMGANDYIVKANYTPAQVVEKVKEHLGINS